jgi:hypothetical protein
MSADVFGSGALADASIVSTKLPVTRSAPKGVA